VRGFIPWLITQRPAVVHKDVLSQADILSCDEIDVEPGPQRDWGLNRGPSRQESKRIIGDLPRLQLCEGYLWARATYFGSRHLH
jgi:hypothetical protein